MNIFIDDIEQEMPPESQDEIDYSKLQWRSIDAYLDTLEISGDLTIASKAFFYEYERAK